MVDPQAYLAALAAVVLLAMAGWAYSARLRNVNIVDALWALFFVVVLAVYGAFAPPAGNAARAWLVMAMLVLWAARLSIHLLTRNHGKPEDRRYAAMRARNDPGFTVKSLYLVFGLQAVLAWIIAAPLVVASGTAAPLNGLDLVGVAIWLCGFLIEAIADRQLRHFKRDPGNNARVMDQGLWRYTRHPNYFGEACVWWGFWLVACAGGGVWTVFSPVIMTFLLLKVSGVALLEKDIAERRPGYREYVQRTNAFLPGLPRRRA